MDLATGRLLKHGDATTAAIDLEGTQPHSSGPPYDLLSVATPDGLVTLMPSRLMDGERVNHPTVLYSMCRYSFGKRRQGVPDEEVS